MQFDAAGRPADETKLRAFPCAELDALAEGRRAAVLDCVARAGDCGKGEDDLALAIDVLTHESFHLAGYADEAAAECHSLQTMAWTAQQFGVAARDGTTARRLAGRRTPTCGCRRNTTVPATSPVKPRHPRADETTVISGPTAQPGSSALDALVDAAAGILAADSLRGHARADRAPPARAAALRRPDGLRDRRRAACPAAGVRRRQLGRGDHRADPASSTPASPAGSCATARTRNVPNTLLRRRSATSSPGTADERRGVRLRAAAGPRPRRRHAERLPRRRRRGVHRRRGRARRALRDDGRARLRLRAPARHAARAGRAPTGSPACSTTAAAQERLRRELEPARPAGARSASSCSTSTTSS